MTQLTDDLFAVEVPSMAFGLMVNNYGNESELMYVLSMEDIADDDSTEETLITKKLPPGNWQQLCTTREATEEIAASIVQIISNGKISGRPQYRRYDRDLIKEMPARCWTRDSRHSLETLLTSKGLDGSKNYVLLKKG